MTSGTFSAPAAAELQAWEWLASTAKKLAG